MISLRVWLERFPSQMRAFVALLAVLSFVAPTWHVCSMGGHVMECGGAMTVGMTHGPFAKSKSGALICFCPPRRSRPPASPFQINGRMNHDANCLALMLASMPAIFAAASHFEVVLRLSFRVFDARREFPTRQFIRTFLGRGPPLKFWPRSH